MSIPILLVSTFLMFFLVTISGDPLAEYRQSTDPNREQTMATVSRLLNLNEPMPQRYWEWITGVVQGDFGLNRSGQDVSVILGQAIGTTLRLVILANILSILLGLLVGIISAVRQYSAIDYTSTFLAFLFFALPVFWLAVLLKEFGAIKFNDYLSEPGLSVSGIIVLSVLGAATIAVLVGGSRERRTIAGGAALVALGALFWAIDATDWLVNPGLSLPVVIALSAAGGIVSAAIYAPLSNTRVVITGVGAALLGVVGSLAFDDWVSDPTWKQLAVLIVLSLLLGAVVGLVAGGAIDRRSALSAGMLASFFVACVVATDQFVSAWEPGRTIATIGPKTPNLAGPFWFRMVDYAGHQILPSLSLALIGFATYMRFTRASMLETLKSDYVRTAKAKGLPATQVVLRHGFRTALIPVMTVVTLSFATLIEGAVITERVFGWKGMGAMFIDGLNSVDPYPVMGFLVVVSVSIVVMNAVADIMYAYLDPRIRR